VPLTPAIRRVLAPLAPLLPFVPFALLFLLAAALGACATAPTVQTEHDPSVDFARYQTYSWREKPSGGTAMSMQRIVGDIDAQLAAKGWRLVPDGGDVVLAAHVATHQAYRLDSFYDAPMWNGWGWYGPWAWAPPYASQRTRATSYTVGTLILDMFDARTKRAVWSAMAESSVPSKPAQVNAKIDQAVAKMFAGFPPGGMAP
jgi:hypothetical protein